jgi:CxxC-x17-CxxC domain-containing protein
MADFKKSGVKRFYENRGNGFDRQDAKRPVFGQKKWDGPSRPVTMHKATCAQCGKPCEVPFRPFDNRLVYCNTCFQGKKGAEDKSYNRFPQRNHNDNKNFTKPGFGNNPGAGNISDLKEQLEMLNAKVDRLIKTMESLANINPASAASKVSETAKTDPVAKSKKEGKKVAKKNKRPF